MASRFLAGDDASYRLISRLVMISVWYDETIAGATNRRMAV